MLVTQSDVFDVPASLTTILTIRELASYQRSLYFKNLLGSDTLSFQIEYSMDGGSTWELVGTAFSLAAGGISVKTVDETGILRVRASGGGDDRDAYIAYARIFDDATHNWTNPTC